jgi:tetratricopeptide (TPR) repeat protein
MSRFRTFLLVLIAFPAISFSGPLPAHVPPGPIAAALSLVESKKVPEAMKILASLQPEIGALGPYHYVYGRAHDASRNRLEASSHYRRASLYATDPGLKETSLFLAIEAESGMGYHFEAKSDCLIFLKKFPDSALSGKIRILLARSFVGIGRSREAVRQFDQAGRSAEALYGKANVLQRMGMTSDASRAYAAAAAVDARYPDASEETRCWLGENLRLSGDSVGAKELLRTVSGEEHKGHAALGLGEIAAAESRTDEAIRLFGSVVSSKDRKLGRIALLRLSDALAAAGKSREASERLEEIVVKYPFTPEYDEACLRISRARASAGDPAAALSLLSKLVLRPSTVRPHALDGIEGILLAERGKGAGRLAALWNAGGRWLMDASREKSLVAIAEEIRGTGAPYLEIVRWLARYGSASVRPKYLALLARHYAEAGDAAGSRECLAGLKAMNAPGDDVARAEAYLKFAEKDYRGAAGTLLTLRTFEEGDIAMLGDTLPHAGDPGKAAAVIEAEASRSGVSARVLGRLADALYDGGRKAESVKYYRMAAEKDPSNEWACYRLAVLLGKDGGDEFLGRIRTDRTLARMAQAARKERTLDAR